MIKISSCAFVNATLILDWSVNKGELVEFFFDLSSRCDKGNKVAFPSHIGIYHVHWNSWVDFLDIFDCESIIAQNDYLSWNCCLKNACNFDRCIDFFLISLVKDRASLFGSHDVQK